MWQTIGRYWAYFLQIKRKTGLFGALRFSLRRVLTKGLHLSSMSMEKDPVNHYGFVFSSPFGEPLNHSTTTKTINWVIPDFGIGSGGHLNIFRVVKKLEEKGFSCRINIDGRSDFSSGEEARKCIRENFFPIDAEVGIGRADLQPADATFATSWTTAYTVRDFRGSGKKYYFVQDFEPYFYAPGSRYSFAEETYKFGFKGITAGDWLAKKLTEEYDMETVPFRFSYDRELYKPFAKENPNTKRVFFYARPITPRRAFELGLLTLARVYEKMPDVEFVLAGWDLSGYNIPFPYQNAGVLSLDELPCLYSQCDIALVLSFTNLSLLPLEAMACNCAVVSNKGENVEWLLGDGVVRFSDASPEALSDAITELLVDEEALAQLKRTGLEFAQSTDWNSEVEKISHEIVKDLSE